VSPTPVPWSGDLDPIDLDLFGCERALDPAGLDPVLCVCSDARVGLCTRGGGDPDLVLVILGLDVVLLVPVVVCLGLVAEFAACCVGALVDTLPGYPWLWVCRLPRVVP